ncbi:LysR substrate-binding domain-containing protein [Amylibacter sp. IMCC11727]|uniref:LysR substrate-binding domain-containing protein n=1 Tax=Amylibacter sp. IMCC11727 TaxID=3039851 RepID=UPI00244DB4EA|nr:LysR substrate-binding domain-containing protein [Amylibacter sp. IMCC11727]WGI21610.1 LysR substrate-binding domain-containing protein [Amylibacter sp. IMCC11727]
MSLPPLPSITALETLDRLGSIKATSEALNLTQSAISHKLKTLEATLGFPLTVADGRGIILTSQARQYVRAVRPALIALQDAHQTISTASGSLTVSCASGFAANWLAPRLSGFRHLFPDIALHIQTQPNANADLFIKFIKHSEETSPLMRVHFFPVCAPHYAIENPIPKRAAQLNPSQLLHLHTRKDWEAWLHTQNATLDTQNGVLFDDVQTMLAATITGQGLSLGDRLTCDSALRSGALIKPYGDEILSEKAYVLETGKAGKTPSAHAFETWLIEQLTL